MNYYQRQFFFYEKIFQSINNHQPKYK
jgi:hypothetical protein